MIKRVLRRMTSLILVAAMTLSGTVVAKEAGDGTVSGEITATENNEEAAGLLDAAQANEDEVLPDSAGVDDENSLSPVGSDYKIIEKPRTSDGVTTWDCIWFGNYWQEDTNGDGHCYSEDYTSGSTTYKADKKQPIKWRVLDIDGSGNALLLADKLIDIVQYNEKSTDVTWETCTMRSYLNGYDGSNNVCNKDFSKNSGNRNFLYSAFNDPEINCLIKGEVKNPNNPVYGTAGGNITYDRLFCLSLDEAMNGDYGFIKNEFTRPSSGTKYYTDADPTRVAVTTKFTYDKPSCYGNTAGTSYWWWLRSPGRISGRASYVGGGGAAEAAGHVCHQDDCLRPAFRMNLSSSSPLWSYAGTVSSDNKNNEVPPVKMPSSPRKTDEGTIWDCIWFGHYYQDNKESYMDKDPIKWRILDFDEVTGEALLLSDKNLTFGQYSNSKDPKTWSDSYIRKWLNDKSNTHYDYMNSIMPRGFLREAFSFEEQAAITNSDIDGAKDKVFLLSVDEVNNEAYGFKNCLLAESSDDNGRITDDDVTKKADNSAFGDDIAEKPGLNKWFLRTPRCIVGSGGGIFEGNDSTYKYNDRYQVRPAIRLNLYEHQYLWSRAGTVQVTPDGEAVSDCNYEPLSVTYSNDRWKFNNSDWECNNKGIEYFDNYPGFSGDQKKYYINKNDYSRFIYGTQETERQRFINWYLDTKPDQTELEDYDHIISQLTDWEGSCFGMSLTEGLYRSEALSIPGYDTLGDVGSIAHSDGDVESLINRYQFMVVTQTTQDNYISVGGDSGSFEKLINKAKTITYNSGGFLIWFSVPENDISGHVILCCDIGECNIIYNGDIYKYRLKIYDPNSSIYDDDYYYLYISEDMKTAYLPQYGYYSKNGSGANGEMEYNDCALTELADFSKYAHPYKRIYSRMGEVSIWDAAKAAGVVFVNGILSKWDMKLDIDFQGFLGYVEGSDYGFRGGTYRLGDIDPNNKYIIKGGENDKLDVNFEYGDHTVGVYADTTGVTSEFSNSGDVELKGLDSTSFVINHIFNEDCSEKPGNATKVCLSAKGSGDLAFKKNADGVYELTHTDGKELENVSIVLGTTLKNDSHPLQDAKGKITVSFDGDKVTVKEDTDGDGKLDHTEVFSDDVLISTITITPSPLALTVGETKALSAKILPENATNKEIEWYSDNDKIAKVDKNGKVTGVKDGSTTIHAKAVKGNATASCEVKVEKIHVKSVSLAKTASVKVGDTITLTPEIDPSSAADKSVTWRSSSPGIASVSTEGVVSGLKEGWTDITVTTNDGGKTATCRVTVTAAATKISVKSVSLVKTASVKVGDNITLTPQIDPLDATDKSVTWRSSAPKTASVSTEGVVTGLKEGYADITVTTNYGGKTAACRVTVTAAVTKISVKSVSLAKTASVKVGDTITLTPQIDPSNATDKSVTWRSSSPETASVSTEGVVTGQKEGFADITVTTNDGGWTAACRVTVIKDGTGPEPDPTDEDPEKVIDVDEADLKFTMVPGEVRRLPINKTGRYVYGVSYTSSNPKIVSVKNGVVTAKKLEKGVGGADVLVTASYCGTSVDFIISVKDYSPFIPLFLKESKITATKNVNTVVGTGKTVSVKLPKNLQGKTVTPDKTDYGCFTLGEAQPDANGSKVSFAVTPKEAGGSYIEWTVKDDNGKELLAFTKVVVKKPMDLLAVNVAETGLNLKVGEGKRLIITTTMGNTDTKDISFSVKGKGVKVSKSGYVLATAPNANAKVTVRSGKISKTFDVKSAAHDGDYLTVSKPSVNAKRPKSGGKDKTVALKLGTPKKNPPAVKWALIDPATGKGKASIKGMTIDQSTGKVTITSDASPGCYTVTATPTNASGGFNTAYSEIIVK